MTEFFRQILKEELEPLKNEILESILQTKEESRYLTRCQVANYLNIGLSTVDLWSRLGKLKKLSIDGSVRFDRMDIDDNFKKGNHG